MVIVQKLNSWFENLDFGQNPWCNKIDGCDLTVHASPGPGTSAIIRVGLSG